MKMHCSIEYKIRKQKPDGKVIFKSFHDL